MTGLSELTINELDQVSGGATDNPVPGGSVYHDQNGTLMSLGNATIFVGNDGTLITHTKGGGVTITTPPL